MIWPKAGPLIREAERGHILLWLADTETDMPHETRVHALKKELGLFDVFAISTGAMFSSGFFLLPGLAFAKTGASVVLAYMVAAVLILPAMFSKAELSTALPRAGGTYYFLDRSLGPLAGAVGGLGTYFALTLKTAFALFGIGAYAALFMDLPIKPVAVALALVFVVINVFGAKETTTLQRWLVITLLAIMALFFIQGVAHLFKAAPEAAPGAAASSAAQPFFASGVAGFLSTIGFVFVSYAGLTKVASVAEEVKNPDRNIPLGMMLSLGVTSLVYAVGVLMIVAFVDAAALSSDLTPVASATAVVGAWLPGDLAVMLIVVAALAAFASTGNAGLLSASRYPFAMARDRLLPDRLATLGRYHTPSLSIMTTGALMIGFILLLNAESLAKLASAFTLFIFMLVNFSVIVMRESKIPSYDPGYRSPFYPWMQIFGILSGAVLIFAMGPSAFVFILSVVVACAAWYVFYAASRVRRHGAIYHWFARLGQQQTTHLDSEFRGILKEKGLRADDPFEEIVTRSAVFRLEGDKTYEDAIALVADSLSTPLPLSAEEIATTLLEGTRLGFTPVTQNVALPHFRLTGIEQTHMVIVQSRVAIEITADKSPTQIALEDSKVHTIFCLVSPEEDPGQHLRILAEIAGRVDQPGFASQWTAARSERELRELLLSPVGDFEDSDMTDDQSMPSAGESGSAAPLLTQILHSIASPDFIAELHDAEEEPQPCEVVTRQPISHQDLEIRLRNLASRGETLGRDRRQLIDAAIDRIRQGTYGRCTTCGLPIESIWLRLRPDTPTCLECRQLGQGRCSHMHAAAV